MSAIALLSELRRHGATILLDDENLRLRPAPGARLASDLIDRVKAAKPTIVAYLAASPTAPLAGDFEERAAIIEYDGGLPEKIARGLATLDTMPVPHGFSPTRWQLIVNGAARFADAWGAKALALGWTPLELWGLHPIAPAARYDAKGLAFALSEGEVVAMDDRQAVIRLHRGGEHRYRRWPADPGASLPWGQGRTQDNATRAEAAE